MSFRELFSGPSKERDSIAGNTSSSWLGPTLSVVADLAGLQHVHERPPHLHPDLCHVIKVLKCLSCFP